MIENYFTLTTILFFKKMLMDNAQRPFSSPDTQTCMSLNDRATRRQDAWQWHSSYLQAAALISTNQSQSSLSLKLWICYEQHRTNQS